MCDTGHHAKKTNENSVNSSRDCNQKVLMETQIERRWWRRLDPRKWQRWPAWQLMASVDSIEEVINQPLWIRSEQLTMFEISRTQPQPQLERPQPTTATRRTKDERRNWAARQAVGDALGDALWDGTAIFMPNVLTSSYNGQPGSPSCTPSTWPYLVLVVKQTPCVVSRKTLTEVDRRLPTPRLNVRTRKDL